MNNGWPDPSPPHDFILNPGSFILNPNNLIVQQANYIDPGVDFNTEDWVPSPRQQQEINALLSDVTALLETQNHRGMARGLVYKFEVDMDYQAKYYAHCLGIEFRFLYDMSMLGEPMHHYTPSTSPAVVPTYPLALCLCRAYEESSFADAVRWHLYNMCTQVFKYLWTTLDTSDQQYSSFQLVLCS